MAQWLQWISRETANPGSSHSFNGGTGSGDSLAKNLPRSAKYPARERIAHQVGEPHYREPLHGTLRAAIG